MLTQMPQFLLTVSKESSALLIQTIKTVINQHLLICRQFETDRLKTSGYKTNKTGFELGTKFEYLEDFRLGLSSSTFVEKN
jgi:hypothetical protein